ncbi:MAG: phage Gp37/Gp68 family protein [Desulfovibrionaceae bacterium]|nr:phage Gp37/Gp68 family protein [Desulfovibrionaceae bacterium]
MATWNPWHGCRKFSPGCRHCYVYRMDAKFGRDPSHFALTASYLLPLETRKGGKRKGSYKLQPDGKRVYTCFTSDFFLEDADQYRHEAWKAIRIRSDLHFYIPTKRIHRFQDCLPPDWGDGYENVTICCTAENQATADKRLPLFRSLPIRHREIIVEPILEHVDIRAHLSGIEHVIVGGESGDDARSCDFQWILSLHRQCKAAHVPFWFKQTGARFINERKILVNVARMHQQGLADRYRLNVA